MLQGILLSIFTGLLWAAIGTVFSRAARRRIDFAAFMQMSAAFTMVGGCLVLVKWPTILDGAGPDAARVGLATFSMGAVGAGAMMLMQKAMRCGHHGAVWTVTQSAMVVPFLAGWLIWGEVDGLPWRVAGVCAMLAGMVALGLARETVASGAPQTGSGRWFLFAFLGFLVLGVSQTLACTSSYEGWKDAARIRVTMGVMGQVFAYSVFLAFRPRSETPRGGRGGVRWALALTGLVLTSHSTFFLSADTMARHDAASVVFPLCIGVCIVSFVLYSLFWMRERATRALGAGVAACLVGIVLIVLGA